MNTSSIPPKRARGATGAEMVGIAVFVALALGFLGFMEFKDVLIGPKAGGYVDIDAITGEWQAAGRPWHIVFRTDKNSWHEFYWFRGTRQNGTRDVSAVVRGKRHNRHEEREKFYGDI